MAGIPIGLQLWSVRMHCAEDLRGTLEKVAEMGYKGVEFAGYYDHTAEQVREILDEVGLEGWGSHLQIDDMVGEKLDQTIEFNKTFGAKFIVVASLPKERCNTRAACEEVAKILSDVAETLEPLGMYTGYHAHNRDFALVEGKTIWETIFDAGSKKLVHQIDAGNTLMGGQDPNPMIEKYPGQSINVHLKDCTMDKGTVLMGEGDVDWGRFFELCETVGKTQYYVMEQEGPKDVDELDRCDLAIQTLRDMGKC